MVKRFRLAPRHDDTNAGRTAKYQDTLHQATIDSKGPSSVTNAGARCSGAREPIAGLPINVLDTNVIASGDSTQFADLSI